MPDLNDVDDEILILYGVNNPIHPLTNSIPLLAGQLFATRRSGIGCQAADAAHDTLSVAFSVDGFDFLARRGLDQNPISSHVS